jgi:hypothetical protein
VHEASVYRLVPFGIRKGEGRLGCWFATEENKQKNKEMGWFREFLRGGEGSSDQTRAKRGNKKGGDCAGYGKEIKERESSLSLGLEEIKEKRGG